MSLISVLSAARKLGRFALATKKPNFLTLLRISWSKATCRLRNVNARASPSPAPLQPTPHNFGFSVLSKFLVFLRVFFFRQQKYKPVQSVKSLLLGFMGAKRSARMSRHLIGKSVPLELLANPAKRFTFSCGEGKIDKGKYSNLPYKFTRSSCSKLGCCCRGLACFQTGL